MAQSRPGAWPPSGFLDGVRWHTASGFLDVPCVPQPHGARGGRERVPGHNVPAVCAPAGGDVISRLLRQHFFLPQHFFLTTLHLTGMVGLDATCAGFKHPQHVHTDHPHPLGPADDGIRG